MKHRLSFLTAYISILCLFTLGAGILLFGEREERLSLTENRMLQAFPEISAEGLLSGEFMEEFEDYLADAFPARDGVNTLSESLLGLWSVPDDGIPDDAELHGQLSAPAEEEGMEPAAEELSEEPETEEAESAAASSEESGNNAELWLIDNEGNKKVCQRYAEEDMLYFAETLSLYRDCLPADGSVSYILTPPTSVGNTIGVTHTASDWGSDLCEKLQPMLSEGCTAYDVTDILRPYLKTEILYYTQDHHWTPRGAWRVLDYVARDKGLAMPDYYDYLYRLTSEFQSDPYDKRSLEARQPNIGDLQIQVPVTPVESYLVTYLDHMTPSDYLNRNLSCYATYLGGCLGPWRYFDTGFHTGRNALVIGDSYTLAAIPYLAPLYDHIVSVDFTDDRYNPTTAGGNVKEYIALYDLSDIYLITGTSSPLSGTFIHKNLRLYLDKDYGREVSE